MHVSIVEIDLTEAVALDDAATLMEALAPSYVALAGLRHKYFLLDATRTVTGGVYVWNDAASAGAWHDGAWHDRVVDTYGVAPRLSRFDVPVEIDVDAGVVANLVSSARAV
jgi:hypothetical protein